jgi:metallo-beta-lactamase superfamily protein
MKLLHRPELFGWSKFDEARNIDFHGLFWQRADGNVAVDPLPLSDHDRAHVEKLGGVAKILLTNSDHTRGATDLAAWTGARIYGPRQDTFPFPVEPIGDGDDLVRGMRIFELNGSKTPGELALLLEGHTVVFGDLVRSHRADTLHFLPPDKLRDLHAAKASLQRILEHTGIRAVLVGDGWPIFRNGHARLAELVA